MPRENEKGGENSMPSDDMKDMKGHEKRRRDMEHTDKGSEAGESADDKNMEEEEPMEDEYD